MDRKIRSIIFLFIREKNKIKKKVTSFMNVILGKFYPLALVFITFTNASVLQL